MDRILFRFASWRYVLCILRSKINRSSDIFQFNPLFSSFVYTRCYETILDTFFLKHSCVHLLTLVKGECLVWLAFNDLMRLCSTLV